jgi:hypothetical protein
MISSPQTGAAPLSCARSSPVSSVSARRSDLYFLSRHAGLLEPKGLQRVRQRQQARRLERMDHAGAIASACCRVFTAADPDQISVAELKWRRTEGARCDVVVKA